MKTVLQQAALLLEKGESFVYTVVISQQGSTPRSAGTKMLVLADEIIGTIGGGATEAAIIRSARGAAQAVIQTHEMTEKTGFLCGGTAEVLIAPIDANDRNIVKVFTAAAQAEREGDRSYLLYVFNGNPGAELPLQICLYTENDGLIGSFVGSEKFKKDMTNSPVRIAIHGDEDQGVRYITEPLHHSGTLYLFGAGHVSKDVASLASTLDFKIVVVDDREEYCNPDRFPGCELHVIESFESLPDFEIDDSSFIMIITRGHAHDRTVLEWALTKEPYYLGMIGSRSKRDKTYESLINQGVSSERLSRIMCPIGLDIGAETTAEIAVSIMAQVISVQHGKGMEISESFRCGG